ncbi:hypothetical protein BDV12DRAFT_194793 [Aspergillus spectabilis]
MTQQTAKSTVFTPEALVEAPRRSRAIPNASGTLAVYTQISYSLRCRMEKRETRVAEIGSHRSWPVMNSPHASFPQWIGHSDRLIWLEAKGNGSGHTQLVVDTARLDGKSYIAGIIPGRVRYLRVASTMLREDGDDELPFTVIGKVCPDGTLFNQFDTAKPGRSFI